MTWAASILLLTALTGSAALAADTDPGAAGAELVGTKAPGWEGVEWLNAEPLRLEDLRGKVVLVRWWTDTCAYCRRSAPALNEFHARYARRGLTVIGLYHPKPIDRPITASEIREVAQERGFDFPIAIDRGWSVLRRWWLDGGRRSATSVSFLIDRSGVIRHVHPGPAFHREVVRGDEQPRRDFVELDRMIDQVLSEPNEETRSTGDLMDRSLPELVPPVDRRTRGGPVHRIEAMFSMENRLLKRQPSG